MAEMRRPVPGNGEHAFAEAKRRLHGEDRQKSESSGQAMPEWTKVQL